MKTIQLFFFVLVGLMCFTAQASVEVTTFTVTKAFTDDDDNGEGPDNPTKVKVTLNCFTANPITQSQYIDQDRDVAFTVKNFEDGKLDCDVSEDVDAPELAGYTPTYSPGGDSDSDYDDEGCHFYGVKLGAENTCAIVNNADPVPVVITKDWIIDGSGGDQVDQHFELTLYCDGQIVGTETDKYYGHGGCKGNPLFKADGGLNVGGPKYESCVVLEGDGDSTFTPHVYPEWPSTHCWVDETVYDDSVEVDNDCGNINVSHGEGDSCLITNTVFFEGIPTLSQYGMALLALLMLGVGMVGFRRFI